MEQGLKSVAHIYSQFTNTVFGLLPKTQNISQMLTLIDMCAKDLFSVYMDNYIRTATTFDAMYTFLYNNYFLRFAFGSVYLLRKKTKAFIDTLELLRFEKSYSRLTLSAKHHNKIK